MGSMNNMDTPHLFPERRFLGYPIFFTDLVSRYLIETVGKELALFDEGLLILPEEESKPKPPPPSGDIA